MQYATKTDNECASTAAASALASAVGIASFSALSSFSTSAFSALAAFAALAALAAATFTTLAALLLVAASEKVTDAVFQCVSTLVDELFELIVLTVTMLAQEAGAACGYLANPLLHKVVRLALQEVEALSG